MGNQTEGIISDIHGLFRYSIPGYIFIFILVLFFTDDIFPFLLNQPDITGLVALSIIVCFILGFIFSQIYQEYFNLIHRKKHFRYILENITGKNKIKKEDPCWLLISKNDTIISQKKGDNDYAIERDRITHLTSKLYMFGAIIASQIIFLFLILLYLLFDFSLFKKISIILSIFFLVYCFVECSHNRKLVREFNKNLVEKIQETKRN